MSEIVGLKQRVRDLARRSRRVSTDEQGFTLVELTSSLAVMLIVTTAAWLLLNTASTNMNVVGNGGQASEGNRAALAAISRDLDAAVLRPTGQSPVLSCGERRFSFLADVDNDGFAELVVWQADDTDHDLVRSVTNAPAESILLTSEGDFAQGSTQTRVVLDNIATAGETPGAPMFSFAVSGTSSETTVDAGVGLVTVHLRNGLPDRTENVVDRTATFRVTVFTINGYN